MSNKKLQISDLHRYVFTRHKDGTDVDKFDILTCHNNTLQWVDYVSKRDDTLVCDFNGSLMAEYHVREITDEIVISRATGYLVSILEVPLDYESNVDAQARRIDLLPTRK